MSSDNQKCLICGEPVRARQVHCLDCIEYAAEEPDDYDQDEEADELREVKKR